MSSTKHIQLHTFLCSTEFLFKFLLPLLQILMAVTTALGQLAPHVGLLAALQS